MSNIAIYGAGKFGKYFYECLEDVDFFIDDFVDIKTYHSKPIYKLEKVSKQCIIYISVLQHSQTIEKKLLLDGYNNVVNFTQSIFKMPMFLQKVAKDNYLWLVEDKEKMLDRKKLQIVEKLLNDTKSKRLLQQIVKLRETLDIKYYIQPEGTEYFAQDVPILTNLESINFIDCGAYIGDTIEELVKQTDKINSTLSFEPDTKNLLKLQEQLEKLKKQSPLSTFFIYPAGVYSSNSVLKFANNGIDSSASFDTSADIEVPVVTLDTVILNSSPNFIKMDIEGAEKEALMGATKTIRKYKPNLAICLYHKPEDLWELPLLIKQIEPSYNMYIRVHEDMCLSTVLYCISKERKDV